MSASDNQVDRDELIVAAVDVGSNSIKLTVAQRTPSGDTVPLAQASETVRLGAGVGAAGSLAGERMDAALAVLTRFAAEARALGAMRLVGVATEAVRRAANGPDFLGRVTQTTGWSVRLISGDEEAALAFRGLAVLMELHGRSVIADIGGGSTELIVAEDTRIESARSLALGSGLLTDQLVHHDPPLPAELSACQDEATAVLAPLPLVGAANTHLIATGGTGEYLTRLVPAGVALDRATIAGILTLLSSIPAAELARMIAIPEARARVLPAGIAVVLALATIVHPAAIATGPSGIRMGLILETFEELTRHAEAT